LQGRHVPRRPRESRGRAPPGLRGRGGGPRAPLAVLRDSPSRTREEDMHPLSKTGAMPGKGRRPARSVVVRRWLAAGALVLVGLLYYRPIMAYVGADGEVAQRRVAVEKLRQEKLRLQARLGASARPATLA